jgi:hypothetical protein
MARVWYIKCTESGLDADTGTLRVTDLQRVRVSQADDRCTFTHDIGDMTAAALFPYKATVTVYYRDDAGDPVTWFVGRSATIPRDGTPENEHIEYELIGPWYYLTRTIYHQRWKHSTGGAAPDWAYSARIIIGQGEDGTRTTTGQQIWEALNYAIVVKGVPLQIPADATGWPDIQVPFDEAKDLYVSDIINRLLQYTPDVGTSIDYSTAPHPTLNLYKRATAPEVTCSLLDPDTNALRITPRHDLQPPGIIVRYETTSEYDGTEYLSQNVETAGNPADFDALSVTIELAGMRISHQYHRVETEDWPTTGDPPVADWLNKAWWKAKDKSIEDIDLADITLETPTTDYPGGLAALLIDYPKILVGDGIPEWLEDHVGTVEVAIEVKAKLIIRKADGGDPDKQTETLSVQLTATNAGTGTSNKRTYKVVDSLDMGETQPVGLAAALYASWGQLQYEGHVTREEVEVTGNIAPSSRLNITNGIAEWAAMNAQIQSVTESADDGVTEIAFGPADHIAPDDLASLLGRFRRCGIAWSHLARHTGKVTSLGGNVNTGGKPAKANTTKAPAEVEKLVIDDNNDGSGPRRQITLDAAEIPTDKGTIEIKPREVYLAIENPESDTRAWRLHQVMASEPYGDPVESPEDTDNPDGEDDPCDQNTHPGTGDEDDTHPGDGDDDGNPHEGEDPTDPDDPDQDDTDHPGSNDCYTTT